MEVSRQALPPRPHGAGNSTQLDPPALAVRGHATSQLLRGAPLEGPSRPVRLPETDLDEADLDPETADRSAEEHQVQNGVLKDRSGDS